MRALLTGATGLVGVETMERLRAAGAEQVVGVSRGRSAQAGLGVTWNMGSEDPPQELRGHWDVIVHAAADTRWTMSPKEAARANVDSVAALAPLADEQTHVVHVSTAFAVGLRGDVGSDRLDDYRNTYEWSKAHAERLAAETFSRLTIVRPPLVIGRREDGHAARFAGMYTVLRAIAASMVPVVIADPNAYLEVIPVDELAKLIVEVAREPCTGRVLTIAGGEQAPRVQTVFDRITGSLNRWRAERDLEPFDAPRLISRKSWERFFLPFARESLSPRQLRILELLANFEPYLHIDRPLSPTHFVSRMESCIETAVRYWAQVEPQRASTPSRPWVGAATNQKRAA